MQQATQHDRESLLQFLAPSVADCLYLYLDIYHYDLDAGEIRVWYVPGEQVGSEAAYELVVMQFGDSLQIYSPNNAFDIAELRSLAEQVGAVRIHARKQTIEYLQPYFEDGYEVAFGQIFEKTKVRNLSTYHHLVERIGASDVEEAARVILTADEFAHSYTLEDMCRTLTGLIESGIGSVFVIRENGAIVATEAITAEADLFLITSYLVTHPEHETLPYGAIIESYISYEVQGEKRPFTMVTNPRRIKLLKMLGNPLVAEYGKLVQSGA